MEDTNWNLSTRSALVFKYSLPIGLSILNLRYKSYKSTPLMTEFFFKLLGNDVKDFIVCPDGEPNSFLSGPPIHSIRIVSHDHVTGCFRSKLTTEVVLQLSFLKKICSIKIVSVINSLRFCGAVTLF